MAEAGFWEGLGRAVSTANVPHTAEQLGQAVGVFVLFLATQAFQWWRTRHAVRSQVRHAVHFLAGVNGMLPTPKTKRARKAATRRAASKLPDVV